MGRLLNANEPVAEDDVEGHGKDLNANEPVAVDDDDVEGHGLLRNAAIAAALTVGGTAAIASPASANPATTTTAAPTQIIGEDTIEAVIIQQDLTPGIIGPISRIIGPISGIIGEDTVIEIIGEDT